MERDGARWSEMERDGARLDLDMREGGQSLLQLLRKGDFEELAVGIGLYAAVMVVQVKVAPVELP